MSRSRLAAVTVVAALTAIACSSSSNSNPAGTATTAGQTAGTGGSVRGFDGTTIKIAGLGGAGSFADADLGTKARFKRANDSNELNGIKLNYTAFADDKQDPATATSEARRLVTQEQVFAIVPDLSAVNPGPYLNQQHVPYVGWGFDNTYCSDTPTTTLYGFGYNGCLVPASPKTLPDAYGLLYKFVNGKTGRKSPSLVLFSNDNQSGKNSARLQASGAEGAGFNVVFAKGDVPITTSDYSPYVQAWLTSDGGKQPDVINCLLAVQCIPIWTAVKAAGFKGTFQTPLYTDALVKALAGTVSDTFYDISPNPGLAQMTADLGAIKPGTKVTSSNSAAYFAADMFIQALKTVGRNVTPEAVQKALANQTWQIGSFVGPTKYPDSTVGPTPACSGLVEDADGTAWKVVESYTCSSKTYPVDPKFQG